MKVWCAAMRVSYVLSAAVLAVTLLAVPGCSKVVAGEATRDTNAPQLKPHDCQPVSGQLTAIDPRTPSEPQLKIPQPPGWERASLLDSEVIRFTMRNTDLAADDFAPTAVVTLESLPAGNSDSKTIFGQERGALVDRLGAGGLRVSETTRCGDDAELVDYDGPAMGPIPPRKIRTLMVVSTYDANTFVATVTVQSTDPDNVVYSRDTETILTGFQMLPPATN